MTTDYEAQQREAQEAHERRVASWIRQQADHKAARDAEWARLLQASQRATERQNAEWGERTRNRLQQLSEPRTINVAEVSEPAVEPVDLDDL